VSLSRSFSKLVFISPMTSEKRAWNMLWAACVEEQSLEFLLLGEILKTEKKSLKMPKIYTFWPLLVQGDAGHPG
jgi:hypothetical protein